LTRKGGSVGGSRFTKKTGEGKKPDQGGEIAERETSPKSVPTKDTADKDHREEAK